MKTKILITITCVLLGLVANAQLLKKVEAVAKRTIENKIEQKTEQKTGEAMDTILSYPEKKREKPVKKEKVKKDKKNNETEENVRNNALTMIKSNNDFEAGTNVIFADDFSQDAIGDFPARWNTNGSGDVVTIDGVDGKWLHVVHNSIIHPVMDKALPENATVEFDLFLQANGSQSTPFIQFGFTSVHNIIKEDMAYKDRFFINLNRYSEKNGKTLEYGLKNDVVGNKNDFPLTKYVNKMLHVAMAINKARIRLYLDGAKVIDLPKVLTTEMRNNFFLNNNYVIPASELGMLISNVRIASAEVDARSLLITQLMEEGKTSTSDILFDINSDMLKTESFNIITQFGDALMENQALKIKIIGHTDSDGADAANLALSQKRAAAVKTYITENYAVAGSRIQTEGKGETQPIAPNTSAAEKSKNRRVEFVKL